MHLTVYIDALSMGLLLCTQWRSQDVEKSFAHHREATGSSSDSLHLRPFSKKEFLLKERICS